MDMEKNTYIVMDLEWNQAADEATRQASSLLFEIIEIGAVKLNSDRQQTDTFHELIRPQVFRRMNGITGELIHLKMEQLRNCRTFEEVARDFLAWCGDHCVFCTWGSSDLTELQRNLEYYGMEPLSNGPIKYYDVQKLFAIAYEDRKTRRSLEYAVDYLEIDKNVAFHRADGDAYYTARVFSHFYHPALFHNYSYDTYQLPNSRGEEIHALFDDYEKYISRSFTDKFAAMRDREVLSTRCFLCGANTRCKIPWFSVNNGKHYYTIVVCKKHGYLKGKIRLRKAVRDESIYVVKTMKQVDESVVEDIKRKKEQTRELRKERRHKS